jgi:mRNA-decapping enzyme subunit 2
MEETGFDATTCLKEDQFIELLLRGEQKNRLYITAGISEQTEFCPQTRKEIGDIKWHRLCDLPGYRFPNGDMNRESEIGTKFFMIRTFMRFVLF